MLPEPNCKWLLVSPGNQRSYKCSQTQGSLSCHQSLSLRLLTHLSVLPHGQHHSGYLCKQQRRNLLPHLVTLTLKLWQ